MIVGVYDRSQVRGAPAVESPRGLKPAARIRAGLVVMGAALVLVPVMGCQGLGLRRPAQTGSTWRDEGVVRRVRCLYDQTPWLNLDRAGDRDPEGIRFRVFLDTGAGRCVHRDGSFYIQLYQIGRDEENRFTRDLVSTWRYPTSDVHTIAKPGMLGPGYFLYLRWATKAVAGHEIEMITEFEDLDGNIARSGTKRLRVPKYSS